MDTCNPLHRKDQLERVGDHRDGHGGLVSAFVRAPDPVILGEWIEPASPGEVIDVEGLVLGHQEFHFSPVFSSCKIRNHHV